MELGKLSAAYESNGDPAIVSTGEGDRGGISYGAYQLASPPQYRNYPQSVYKGQRDADGL